MITGASPPPVVEESREAKPTGPAWTNVQNNEAAASRKPEHFMDW